MPKGANLLFLLLYAAAKKMARFSHNDYRTARGWIGKNREEAQHD
jgi:hypothetical protein